MKHRIVKMFKLTIISLIIPLALSSLLQKPRLPWYPKIVGGLPIGINQAPYQVSLQDRGFHICGASIISENFVITAAHCTSGNTAASLKIRAGSDLSASGGVLIQVAEILQHESFDSWTIDFDFSILKLEESLKFSETIQPVALPTQDEEVPTGILCFVTGWGNTQNSAETREKLRGAFVPSVKQESCFKAYGNFGEITARMICAGYTKGGKDACQGLQIYSFSIKKFHLKLSFVYQVTAVVH